MKIAGILGSPRPRGNSAVLARAFVEQAAGLGAQTELFSLNKLKYRGCQACYQCKTGQDRCAVHDDLSPVLDSLAQADVWVIASPIYFGQISGQLKTCLDRWFSFLTPDYMTSPNPCRLAPGKQSVWILSQAGPVDRFGDVFPLYTGFLQWFGFKKHHLLRAAGTGQAGAIDVSPHKVAEAQALARQIVG